MMLDLPEASFWPVPAPAEGFGGEDELLQPARTLSGMRRAKPNRSVRIGSSLSLRPGGVVSALRRSRPICTLTLPRCTTTAGRGQLLSAVRSKDVPSLYPAIAWYSRQSRLPWAKFAAAGDGGAGAVLP